MPFTSFLSTFFSGALRLDLSIDLISPSLASKALASAVSTDVLLADDDEFAVAALDDAGRNVNERLAIITSTIIFFIRLDSFVKEFSQGKGHSSVYDKCYTMELYYCIIHTYTIEIVVPVMNSVQVCRWCSFQKTVQKKENSCTESESLYRNHGLIVIEYSAVYLREGVIFIVALLFFSLPS
jgi:hypothetical protein